MFSTSGSRPMSSKPPCPLPVSSARSSAFVRPAPLTFSFTTIWAKSMARFAPGASAAAREAGVEIRTKAPVGKILVKNGRAAGVVLQSGEEIFANVVSSSVDPHLTFEKFLEPSELPADFLEGVRRYKFRGSSGKVNLALDAIPNFKCLPGPGAHLRGAISISPSMEYMERAYDDAKYGRYSRKPY